MSMANAPHRAKKTKKNRKHGRATASCLIYKNSHKREQNKAVRLKRHLKKFPDDVTATDALARCNQVLGRH
jgi:hypothetical protein